MQPTKARSSVAYSVHAKMNFRIIVVGDSGVGKTSLILKYVKGTFSKIYTVSLGVQFYSKMIEKLGQQIALQIWDTAGQQNFKSIVKSFYNKASCVIITYSDPKTLEKAFSNYIYQINEHALEGVRVAVARTKIDEAPVTEQQIKFLQKCKQQKKIDIWKQVSAKNGQNIETFFDELADQLYQRYLNDEQFREIVNPKKDSFLLDDQKQEIDGLGKKPRNKCC